MRSTDFSRFKSILPNSYAFQRRALERETESENV